MDHHFRGYGGTLHHSCLRSQISLQHGDSAGFGVGIFYRADYVRVLVDAAGNIFSYRLSGNGNEIRV